MGDEAVKAILGLLAGCTPAEQEIVFRHLRKNFHLHPYEQEVRASAEMILEAVHRAPELTRRMLRGVIADAAFGTSVVSKLNAVGWTDVTPPGNWAYDYMLQDSSGRLSVQVKLQRSERGEPVLRSGQRYSFDDEVYIVETQKTRTGQSGDDKTRPYRYGEFDILAVSMQPSTLEWDQFMFTLGRWLIPGKGLNEIATLQPVTKEVSDFWTKDFEMVAQWFREADDGKRMSIRTVPRSASRKKRQKP